MGKFIKKAFTVIVGVALLVVGVVTGNPYLIGAGLAVAGAGLLGMMAKKPGNTNAANDQRLSKRLDPETNRKIVFGQTCAPFDVRYWEAYGKDNCEYIEVSAVATHRIHAFGEIYMEDTLAVNADGSVTSAYSSVLGVYRVTEGVSGAGPTPVGASGKWTTASSMTGCAYVITNWVYHQDKLPSGIPTRVTCVVQGAPVYDPRRDVSLGGTHDITDQATWDYGALDSKGVPIGRNNALQMLWYQLGWRINGHLVAGRGVDPNDLDMDAWIQAANDCEVAGYYTDCVLSTGDTHSNNEQILSSAAGAHLLDTGGRISYAVAVDDTANVALYLNDDDIIGNVQWTPRGKIADQFNEVAGTYTDPSSLYQSTAYSTVTDPAYVDYLGYRKRKSVNFQAIQDPTLAGIIAKYILNRGQTQGVFQANFTYRAFKAKNWQCVKLTFSRYGWVNKLFRIVGQELTAQGGVTMTLQEEDPQVFLGGTIEIPVGTLPGAGDDPRAQIPVQGLGWQAISKVSNDSKMVQDGLRLNWTRPSTRVKFTEAQYKLATDANWASAGTFNRAAPDTPDLDGVDTTDSIEIWPLPTASVFDMRVRHISVFDVPGQWLSIQGTTGSTTSMDAGLLGGAENLQAALDAVKAGQDTLAELALSLTAFRMEVTGYLDNLTHIGDVPVGTVVINNEQAQADQNAAFTDTLSVHASQLSTNAAAIVTEATTRATADSATASVIAKIGALSSDGSAFILDSSTVKITNGGSPVVLATKLSGIDTSLGTNAAAIATEQTARINGDNANASSISTLSTTVGGHTASITTLQTSVNGIDARWTLSVASGNVISGITASAGASTANLSFLSNQFYFTDSSGGNAVNVATYSGGVWRFSASIEAQAIKANTIVANHIVGGAVTGTSIQSGGVQTNVVGTDTQDILFAYTTIGGTVTLQVYAELGTSTSTPAGTVVKLLWRPTGGGTWTQIGYGNIYVGGNWGGTGVSFPVVHTPSAGSQDYKLVHNGTNLSGTSQINYSVVALTELKR